MIVTISFLCFLTSRAGGELHKFCGILAVRVKNKLLSVIEEVQKPV